MRLAGVYQNTTGAAALQAAWRDPEFDPATPYLERTASIRYDGCRNCSKETSWSKAPLASRLGVSSPM